MAEQKIYERSKIVFGRNLCCPGCYHSNVVNAAADAMDELGISFKDVVICWPAGCAGVAGALFVNTNRVDSSHGRAACIATGIKRTNPDKIIFAWQGDGDLSGIGLGETLGTANRGENITTLFINNQVYGTTSGQMAPTTLTGQKTTTTPFGRSPEAGQGYPLHMSEIVASFQSPKYVARVTFTDAKNTMFARKCIKKAIETQKNGLGYSFVEILSICPTNWHMSVGDSVEHIKNVVSKEFPIGEFKTY